MSLHKLATAGVLVALLAGCATTLPLLVTPSPIASPSTGNPGPTPKCGPPSTCGEVPSPTARPAPTGPSAEIEIDISGGPHAGSYRAVAPDGCDSKPAQDRFTVTYADDAAADGFAWAARVRGSATPSTRAMAQAAPPPCSRSPRLTRRSISAPPRPTERSSS